MYHRRYSGGVDSRDSARRGVIPVPARSYEPRAVVRRVRGLQLAAAAIPADQFCRGENCFLSNSLSLSLSSPRSPNRQENSRLRARSQHRPSLILSLPHNCSIRRHNLYPLTGAAVMRISMRWAAAAGVTFSFSFRVPFSISVICSLCTLSISAVDPLRARYRRSNRRIYNSGE